MTDVNPTVTMFMLIYGYVGRYKSCTSSKSKNICNLLSAYICDILQQYLILSSIYVICHFYGSKIRLVCCKIINDENRIVRK